MAAWRLGAGRARKEDAVQAGAGVRLLVDHGAQVEAGPAAAGAAHRHPGRRRRGTGGARRAVVAITDGPAERPALLLDTIR